MTHLRFRRPARIPLRTSGRGISALLAVGALAATGCGAPPGVGPSWKASSLEVSFLDPAGMPHLSPAGDGALLSWWAPEGEGHVLRAVSWTPAGGFGPVREVTRGTDFFVNWADFPSVVEVAPGEWVAHWLQRAGDGTYAYGIRIAVSEDAGETWSAPWTPHEDETPTEHGFVSIWPEGGGGWSAVWLDGRQYAPGPHGDPTDEMTVRARSVSREGTPGPEAVLDHRGCDCCQTDVAVTSRGPVVVYRDRTEDEIRDISISRREGDRWTPGRPVHQDGWVIAACPVNGPAVDAAGEDVVVAWFTGAEDRSRVQVAFSSDAGDTFSGPIRVDDGRPVGRVDVVRLPEGDAVVAWLEETDDGAEVRLRRVAKDGEAGASWMLAATSAARAGGFPQFVALSGGSFLAAWTEVRDGAPSRMHLALVEGS